MSRSKQEGARKPIVEQKANLSDYSLPGAVLSILHWLHHLILPTIHHEVSAIIILILQIKNLKDQEVE